MRIASNGVKNFAKLDKKKEYPKFPHPMSSSHSSLLLVSLLALGGFIGIRMATHPVALPPSQESAALQPTGVVKSIGSSDALMPLDKVLAPDEPWQSAAPARPTTYRVREYELSELAYFDATVLVLSTKAYPVSTVDKESHRSLLAPMDIAVGWGAMSNPKILGNFRYYQSDRFFHFANYVDFATQADALKTDEHLANIHIIPASTAVSRALENLHPNMLVRLVGSLVEVRQVNGGSRSPVIWRISLSRTDQGDGACELLYLKRLEWNQIPHEGYALAPEPIAEPAE